MDFNRSSAIHLAAFPESTFVIIIIIEILFIFFMENRPASEFSVSTLYKSLTLFMSVNAFK